MRKNKLIAEIPFDYFLVGIITSLRDFKIAWTLNNVLPIHLVKNQDLSLEVKQNEFISIGYYSCDSNKSKFRLIKNKAVENTGKGNEYFIPEYKHFDYFILVEGEPFSFSNKNIIEKLRGVRDIEYIATPEIKTSKSKEHFLLLL